jgi:hypothetical protein
MYQVDRSVAVIKPRQAFLEWLKNMPGYDLDLTLDQLRMDCTVLLIPEFGEPEEAVNYIDDIYLEIFEAELGSWNEDEATWPAGRSLRLFWEWFDVELHSTVIDTLEE